MDKTLFSKICGAVIFCGGKGTRLSEILQYTPKAMAKIGDMPYVISLLKWLVGYGVSDVTLCVSALTLSLADAIQNGTELGLGVDYSIDSGAIENAGALYQARNKLTKPLLLCINGDTIVDINIHNLIHFHMAHSVTATLVGSSRIGQPHPEAVEVGIDNLVTEIFEDTQDEGVSIIQIPGKQYLSNSGVYVFNRDDITQDWPQEYHQGKLEQGYLKYLAKKKRLASFNNEDRYLLDFGTPDRFQKANNDLGDITGFFPL